MRQLGTAFSGNLGANRGSQLYTGGLYSHVRHPSYAGLLLSFFGVALAFAHPVSSAMAMVLPTAAVVYRISLEEKVLVEQWGHGYRHYAARTKKLLPGVY